MCGICSVNQISTHRHTDRPEAVVTLAPVKLIEPPLARYTLLYIYRQILFIISTNPTHHSIEGNLVPSSKAFIVKMQ